MLTVVDQLPKLEHSFFAASLMSLYRTHVTDKAKFWNFRGFDGVMDKTLAIPEAHLHRYYKLMKNTQV